MPIQNNVRHLAFVKRTAKSLRSSGAVGAFFVVIHRDSGEVLLHLDTDATPEIFRNPDVIRRRLKRYKVLQPKSYDDFFADVRALVSMAGEVTVGDDGRTLIFERTVRTGRANKRDLTLALKTFRFLKGKPGTRSLEGEEDAPVDDAATLTQVATLFARGPLSGEQVASQAYEAFGSIDGLIEATDALSQALRDNPDPARSAQLAAMQEAYAQLDTWNPDIGMQGVNDGFSELVSQAELDDSWRTLVDAFMERVEAAWTKAMARVSQVEAEADLTPHTLRDVLLAPLRAEADDVFGGAAEGLAAQVARRLPLAAQIDADAARVQRVPEVHGVPPERVARAAKAIALGLGSVRKRLDALERKVAPT